MARVLVVDDAIFMRATIGKMLEEKGHSMVGEASTGIEAVEKFVEVKPDVVILDITMPEMDGIETLHRIKKMSDHACQNVPIVALTANAISGAKEMYLKEGFEEFLSKPINPERLEQMIVRLLPKNLVQYGADSGYKRTNVVSESIEELPIVDGIDWNYGFLHFPTKELLKESVALNSD